MWLIKYMHSNASFEVFTDPFITARHRRRTRAPCNKHARFHSAHLVVRFFYTVSVLAVEVVATLPSSSAELKKDIKDKQSVSPHL